MPDQTTPSLFGRLRANRTGFKEACFGYAAGYVVASIIVALTQAADGGRSSSGGFASEVAGVTGLWLGFAGAAVFTLRSSGFGEWPTLRALREAFGVAIRPIDVPIGILAGLVAQYVFVPVSEVPLLPFVPHLYDRLGTPARSLTAGISTPGLVILGIIVCVGSPMFEELFFRGVLLRGIAGMRGDEGPVRRRVAVVSTLCTGVLFGLAHFEPLELLGLIAAGLTFGTLASSSGRLGASFFAHVTFNAVTFISVTHAF